MKSNMWKRGLKWASFLQKAILNNIVPCEALINTYKNRYYNIINDIKILKYRFLCSFFFFRGFLR